MSGDEVTTRAWLDARRPEAPEDLRRRIDEACAILPASLDGRSTSPRAEALLRVGQERLEAAVGRPGRVRESAFELLVADALVTHACEAALEADHPAEVLDRLVKVGRIR